MLVEIPDRFLPNNVGPATADLDTLAIAARTAIQEPYYNERFDVKPWIVLFLLDAYFNYLESEGKNVERPSAL